MAQDNRESRSAVSGSVVIPSNNSDEHVAVELRDGETLAIDTIKVQYSEEATSTTLLEMDDANEDTEFSDGENSDNFILNPGDEVTMTGATYSDINDGVSVKADGDNDGRISFTVGGMKVTG